MDKLIRKYVLQNAIKFNGKANPSAIIGKLFAEDPALKKQAKDVSAKIAAIVREINFLSVEEQREELKVIAPTLLEKKEKKERNIFAFLKVSDGVITAFPPGPEKYPHIGHAKACLLNYFLAKQYGGKFILRFEDTNPKTVKSEFYDIMQDNFKWLGVEWDELLYASDFMDLYYEHAKSLLDDGLAYVDTSSQEDQKKSREIGVATKDRSNSSEKNLELFEKMSSAKEGFAVVRLKIDLKHKNTTMRDPTIMRIIDEKHPRIKKHRIWPNYDFQNAIMDAHSGVGMRLRSKEFELRAELQHWIQSKLGLPQTRTFEFGRFNLKGVESSGRVIREKVELGELIGWDDPTLTTLVALRRRGFLPEAIKHFVISTGISKAEAVLTWDDLIMHNKRLLDNSAKRFSAIFDGVDVTVEGCPSKQVELHLNPNEKKGGRPFTVDGNFILSETDLERKDKKLRLMDCINVSKSDHKLIFESENYSDFAGKKVIHWLPADGNVSVEVLMTDKTVLHGVAEHTVHSLQVGEVIQFERFGFCRLDRKEKGTLYFWFAHK